MEVILVSQLKKRLIYGLIKKKLWIGNLQI